MAKLFYTLEEAAQQLGVSEDQVRTLAANGKLQQFRDRVGGQDKLMFKKEHVDSLAAQSGGGKAGESAELSADDSQIELAEPAERAKPDQPRKEDPRQATGISVFDTGEVEPADPMAQTQVTNHDTDNEALALESVGSGSGLLDLTRESDDTSLGAELLDEIYPGSGEGSDAKLDSSLGASAIINDASAIGSAASLENAPSAATPVQIVYGGEPTDTAGSWMSIGLLVGAAAAIVIALIVTIAAIGNVPVSLTASLSGSSSSALILAAVLLGISAVLGLIGFFLGKNRA